jgi:Lon protease-like protein
MSATTIELPLFPLEVVLFPGTVHPLHIFEPRYRQMIQDCLNEDKPFGIVLAREESKHLREVPYSVGTMVEIHQLKTLDNGCYNLMAVGAERFRILDYHREKPYLLGVVEPFEDNPEPEELSVGYARRARALFIAYLNMLLSTPSEQEIAVCLPIASEPLSHFIAYFLDIEDRQKQSYLEMTSTFERIRDEVDFLRHEVPFMREITQKKFPQERLMLN